MRLQIEVEHLGKLDANILVPSKQTPKRRRDVALREDSGRHLVQQRLEEMMVGAINECDLNRRSTQEASCVQAPETAADDDDPMTLWIGGCTGGHRRSAQRPAGGEWASPLD